MESRQAHYDGLWLSFVPRLSSFAAEREVSRNVTCRTFGILHTSNYLRLTLPMWSFSELMISQITLFKYLSRSERSTSRRSTMTVETDAAWCCENRICVSIGTLQGQHIDLRIFRIQPDVVLHTDAQFHMSSPYLSHVLRVFSLSLSLSLSRIIWWVREVHIHITRCILYAYGHDHETYQRSIKDGRSRIACSTATI